MRRFRKIINMAVTGMLAASILGGCAGKEKLQITGNTYPYLLQAEKDGEVIESEATLYFIDGGDIPYVKLSEYMPILSDIYRGVKMGDIGFEVKKDSYHYVVTRDDNGSEMYVNPDDDYIMFLDMDSFTMAHGDTVLVTVSQLPDVADQAGLFRDSEMSFNRHGTQVMFRLADYNIDLVEADGECYVPLQTMTDIFVNWTYIYMVFNGQKLIGSIYGGDLIDRVYDAPTGEMSQAFALFNYNELRFLLDSFYGLKEEHGISDFGDFLTYQTGLYLADTDPKQVDDAINTLCGQYFDDLHSSFIKPSWMSGKMKDEDIQAYRLTKLGPSSISYLMGSNWTYSMTRGMYYPEDPPGYEEVGDTAFITFDKFTADRTDYRAEGTPDDPQDTVELIMHAHEMISRENSPVRNVVLDLTMNTGGNADAATFVLAWCLGNSNIALRNTLTGAESIMSLRADVNLDGEYDMYDRIPEDIRIWCLTSPVSFSCGNLVPAVLKNSDRAILLGQHTSGGSCVVLPCSTASGTLFTISGNRQISIVKNGSFYNVDEGVEPHYILSRPESIYDRQELVRYMQGLK